MSTSEFQVFSGEILMWFDKLAPGARESLQGGRRRPPVQCLWEVDENMEVSQNQ